VGSLGPHEIAAAPGNNHGARAVDFLPSYKKHRRNRKLWAPETAGARTYSQMIDAGNLICRTALGGL